MGIRREGDEFNPGSRVLPEYSDVVVDTDLDGLDRDDTYREWKYDPELKGKKKTGDTYADRIKAIGGVAKDIIGATRGKEPKRVEEEVIIVRKLSVEAPLSEVPIEKKSFVERSYKELVRTAYDAITNE